MSNARSDEQQWHNRLVSALGPDTQIDHVQRVPPSLHLPRRAWVALDYRPVSYIAARADIDGASHDPERYTGRSGLQGLGLLLLSAAIVCVCAVVAFTLANNFVRWLALLTN